MRPRETLEAFDRYLADRHRAMIGPTYRADVWAALVAEPELSAAQLARQTYASFATAWQAKRDFAIAGHPEGRTAHHRARGRHRRSSR